MSKVEVALTFDHTNRHMEMYRKQQKLAVQQEIGLYQAIKHTVF